MPVMFYDRVKDSFGLFFNGHHRTLKSKRLFCMFDIVPYWIPTYWCSSIGTYSDISDEQLDQLITAVQSANASACS